MSIPFGPRRTFIFFLFLFSQNFISQIVFSQESKKPILQLLLELQQMHSQKILYNTIWFEGDSASENILFLPISEALDTMLSDQNMDVVSFQKNLIIVPKESVTLSPEEMQDSRQVVGNPIKFGKYSKATVSGKVVDGETAEPLIGAIIYIENLAQGTSTNVNGEYSIELPVGEHLLKLSYIGYGESFHPIRLLSPGVLNLEIFERSHALESVSIYAKREDLNISQTQMSVVRIDAKSIRLLPTSLGETDVIKSITLMPGVQSVGEFGSGFNVRGGSADQNLILIEGVPLFNSSHLFGLTSLVNPDMVSSITLIKAGIPAKYGERASSVMDIRIGGGNEGKFRVNGGVGLLNSRLSIETPLPGKKGYFLIGGRSTYSNWLLNKLPNEDLMNSSALFYDINGLINLPLNSNHSITIFGYTSYDSFSLSDNIDYNYANNLASFRLAGHLSSKLLSNLTLGHSSYNYGMDNNNTINPINANRFQSGITYNSLKWNLNYYRIPSHAMEFGINTIIYGIDPGKTIPIGIQSTVNQSSLEKEQALEVALYIGNTIEFTEEFSADMGLRLSQFFKLGPGTSRIYNNDFPMSVVSIIKSQNYGKNEIMAYHIGLEPRLGLRYQLNPSSSIKLSYNRGNQYVNLISTTAISTPSDIWYLSNKHHSPTLIDQLALGFFKNFSNNTIESSIELYYKNLQNVLETKNNAQILMNTLLEADLIACNGYSYGLELYFKKISGNLTGWISYTFSHSMRKTSSIHTEEQINANVFFPSNFDSPHNLVLNSNLNLSRRWRVGASFTYNTGRPITLPELSYNINGHQLIHYSDRNQYRLPDYHRLDLSLSYDGSLRLTKKWKSYWTISVINVYSRKNIQSIYYEKTTPSPMNNYQKYSLYKLTIIGRPLPTLTYNFTF
jgi:hypothetical protein